MKKSKKLAICALSTMLVGSLTAGTSLLAFADSATKGHDYDAKNDVVFEDFDRDVLGNGVVASATGVQLGEKPYLHVEYEAATEIDVGQIYKQGSGSIGSVKEGGTIKLKMRAPQGDVALSELMFGIRGDGLDSDEKVYGKCFTELSDSSGADLPALTTEWQTYEISFATSYEDTEKYPDSTTSIVGTGSVNLTAIHLWAKNGETGTLEIASVMYNTSADVYLNNFTGGDRVVDTAKAVDTGTWWSDSATGYIVKRVPSITTGELSVVKSDAVGNYGYAVIETTGDKEHLKVATTTDGTTWGTAAAYDGYSVALTGEEKGFKFSYDGAESVGIKRIYLTNVMVVPDAKLISVLDPETVDALEDFSVAQSGITGDWDSMSTRPELEKAGLEYRLSYADGNKVEVKDGCLVFDATTDYTNFKFKSKTSAYGSYIVLKVKSEGEGASIDKLRFKLIKADDTSVPADYVWGNSWKAGHNLASAKLSGNPYTADGWSYVVIDLEESGFGVSETGYAGMDIYYTGAQKLYIDSVFFADGIDVPHVVLPEIVATSPDKIDFAPTAAGYQYAGYIGGLTAYDGNVLKMDITVSEGTDLSGVRLGFDGGIRWFSENAEGSLYTLDGKLLSEVTFTANQAKTVYIDLVKSGVGVSNFHIHTNGTGTGSFKLENIAVGYGVRSANSFDFTPSADGYQYVGKVEGLNGARGNVLQMDITVSEGTDLSTVRLGFDGGVRWFGENAEGSLYTTDGKLLSEVAFTAGTAKTVYIDLDKSNVAASDFHIHSNGNGTGAFKIENVAVSQGSSIYTAVAPDSTSVVESSNTVDFTPTEAGYQYAGYVGSLKNGVILKMDITVSAGTDLSGVRLEFVGSVTKWFGENDAGSLYTTDGTLLSAVNFVAGTAKTVEINVKDIVVGDFHVHTNGTGTGAFKIENVKVIPYVDYGAQLAAGYAAFIDGVEDYFDNTAPTVAITTATTATVGDQITVAYTASDDRTATDDLTVTVAVTLAGEKVTLTDNKFTAAEGVYTIVVTATDKAGNEGSATIQVTVSAPTPDPTPDPTPTPDPEPSKDKKGCLGSFETTAIISSIALLGAVVVVFTSKALRKRED